MLAGQPLREISLPSVSHPFNNRGLFSDHYLETVVPTFNEWTAGAADEEKAALADLWQKAAPLLGGHEGQTEAHWIRPVLERLGFSFQVQTAVPVPEGGVRWPDYALFDAPGLRSQAESFAGTKAYFGKAVAIADAKVWDAKLDRKARDGESGRNPNYQIDLYLRHTDCRWGMLTNGRLWRLYCRDTSYRLDSFYEVDLIELLERQDDSFEYFWLFFRAQAFRDQPESFLDRVRSGSREFAESLSSRVKGRVYEALSHFVNGFFSYPGNDLDPAADLGKAYAGSLILLYRILFALYAEAQGLLPLDDPGYRGTYSILRIKSELADRLDKGTELLKTADNYFRDLKNLFRVIDEGAAEIGVPPYNGGLFAEAGNRFLSENEIGDWSLAHGLDLLARVPAADGGHVFVDFNTLEVRHLGDIYEGLLEYQAHYAETEMVAVRDGRKVVWVKSDSAAEGVAVVDRVPAGACYLATGNGERRATGSYYTPQGIVERMVSDSLGRVVGELEAESEEGELVRRLLAIRVCDPAMGSAHFLVEVVDFLARAIVRAGGDLLESDENELMTAKRAVVERCIYGVDPNPLAVELAKLSLWLTTVAHDRPLSFIDNHLVCGNSLIGTDIEKMASLRGGEDQQMNLVEEALGRVRPRLIELSRLIAEQDSDTIKGVHEKQRLFDAMNRLRGAFIRIADLWTAQHFGLKLTEDDYLHAMTTLEDSEPQSPEQYELDRAVALLSARFRFHHWQLAFPEVFLNEERVPGFDVVITNPPYVSAIARSSAYTEWENKFWRGRFEGAADAYDLYLLFIELGLRLSRIGGWVNIITPNKVLSAPYAKALRRYVVENHALFELIDASRIEVFEDPSVYPVLALYRAGPEAPLFVEVSRLTGDGGVEHVASHPSDSLSRLPECIWAFLVLDDADLLLRISATHPQLEGHLGMRAFASTTAREADEYVPEIQEEKLANSPGWRLVNTGTIAPFSARWGLDLLKKGGNKYLNPVIAFRSSAVSAARRDQYWAPKLICKKICLQLEACLDDEGEYASMDTNFVLPGEVDLFALAALMHSALLTWVFEGYFGALRMSGGYMQTQAPQLRVLPIPEFPIEEEDGSYARLKVLGREWHRAASETHERKVELIAKLFEALGVAGRREADPAFMLPRQARIIDELENPAAEDLSGFWKALRPAAKQLKVSLTPKREESIIAIAREGRKDLLDLAGRIEETRTEVDEVVFALYDLSSAERERVLGGHMMPSGLVEDGAAA